MISPKEDARLEVGGDDHRMSSATETVPAAGRPAPVRARGAHGALLSLGLVGGVSTLAVMAWTGGWFEHGVPLDGALPTLLFVLWNLAPFAGAVALVVVTRRRQAGGTPALLVGLLALVGLSAWLLHGMVTSESSTAALLLVLLPLYQWLLLGVAAAASALLHRWRTRRWRARRRQASCQA